MIDWRNVLVMVFSPSTWIGAVVYAILFFALAKVLARVVHMTIRRALARDTEGRLDVATVQFIGQLVRIAIYVVAVLAYMQLIPALRSVGTTLLASAGLASVILGLAAQSTLSNMVAGLSLLLYRPFDVGDRIQVQAPSGLETGTVESLNLGYTVLQTYDNRRVVIPNSAMASQTTINLTARDPRVLAMVPIGISYSADVDRAREILLELAAQHPLVQEVHSCPVTSLGDFSVTLTLRAWCANPIDAVAVQYDLFEQAKRRFDAEGIEIPFPYTNVIVKAAPPASNASAV